MRISDEGDPPASVRRKYRRFEASPASGTISRSSARNGSAARRVSATRARAGGAGAAPGGGAGAVVEEVAAMAGALYAARAGDVTLPTGGRACGTAPDR